MGWKSGDDLLLPSILAYWAVRKREECAKETGESELVYSMATASLPARVAKLADARDLKSRVSKETYRFNSDPGHHSQKSICRY